VLLRAFRNFNAVGVPQCPLHNLVSLQCLPHHHDQLIQFNVQAAGRAGEGHNGQLPSCYRNIVPPFSLRNWWAIRDPSCITMVRQLLVNGKILKIRQWSSTAPAFWQGASSNLLASGPNEIADT
jgi:hypothetical protein